MSVEHSLAQFVTELSLASAPDTVQKVAKHVLLTVLGTGIAGARENGVDAALAVYGGEAPHGNSATVLARGHKLPAANAAAVNGLICRALDYCDAMAPGLHIGSSLVPAALAAAELSGGCSGADFLEALIAGGEVASRMNLDEASYAGLDPTGVAGVFASTAAAAKIFRLSSKQTLHALALAFNRCSGSFQSNIDGSLAVRMIQGWVAADGVTCARLAQMGLTGPERFITGVYGYANLYARRKEWGNHLTDHLGDEYFLLNTMFKKYPSCGLTQGVTELALGLREAVDFDLDEVSGITVQLPPYAHKLVGHPFTLGDNPRVNAQFSAQYCVANALIRRSSTLDHFRPENIIFPAVVACMKLVKVETDESMSKLHHTAASIEIQAKNGRKRSASIEIAPGFPGNPLSEKEHVKRFHSCLDYSGQIWPTAKRERLIHSVMHVQELGDVRKIIQLCNGS